MEKKVDSEKPDMEKDENLKEISPEEKEKFEVHIYSLQA